MKWLTAAILSASISLLAGIFMPWWSAALGGVVAALLIRNAPWKTFLAAFAGVFVAWFAYTYFTSAANEHILANRMAPLLAQTSSVWILWLASALIGGFTSGLAALSVSLWRKALQNG